MRTSLVKSAARVLDLLEVLACASGPLRLSTIAERLAIPKSSAFALLGTLVAKGYAEEGPEGFRLVERFAGQGWIAGDAGLLLSLARPEMAELAAASGESAFLGVLTPACEVRYLHKALCASPVRYDGALEQTRPAYCTSIGQILLADLAEDEFETYLARLEPRAWTPATPTGIRRIREAVRAAAARGYAHTVDGHVAGAAGVAAAIRDGSGRAVAGLALIGPTWRFARARAAHARAVRAAAARIGAALSARRPLPTRRAS
ncbi:MAG: helix-turn-helix domain-containing protein [Alphaproteobacteria bacterium]|nr:helix-turn-helix domain-containing protein [Alphaproteobacteria bacterium]